MLQVGAELLGQGDLAADIEIVRLTIALVRAAGLQDFQVNLGHVGVLAPGIAALDEALRADVRRWIDRKDRGSLCRALAGATGDAATLTVLPFVIGRREALDGRARPRAAGGAARARAPAGARRGPHRGRADARGLRSGRGARPRLLHRRALRGLRRGRRAGPPAPAAATTS